MKKITFLILGLGLTLGWARPRESARPVSVPEIQGRPVVVNPLPRSVDRTDTTTIWFDDLEGDVSQWTVGEGWELSTASSSSPTHSYRYDDDHYGTSSALVTPTISLPELSSSNELIKFSFDLWCDYPDFDGDGDNFLEDYYWVDVANLSDVPLYFHASTANAFEGNSWWCSDETIGGYSDGWLQALESPEFTVSGTSPTLTFKMFYAIEPYSGPPETIGGCQINGWDAANVRISTDGGNTWSVLTGSPSYTSSSCYGWFYNDEDCNLPGWGGYSNTWVDGTFDLSAYSGSTVKIRFYFGSDPAYSTSDDATITGLYLDNILISNTEGDTLLFDNADDQVVMTPVTGGSYQWEQVFYDYGDITRPGGLGWATYMPGDPFNGNTQLDLTSLAGNDIKLRFTARVDDNDDGGNGEGLFIDDVHVWLVSLEESIPVVQNLTAEAGDGTIHLTWDSPPTDFNGLVQYDDGSFENAINMTSGTSIMGTYFDVPFGVEAVTVNSASVFGVTNLAGATTLYGYPVNAGIPADAPTYSTAVTTVAEAWTDVNLGWTFSGDFILAIEISTTVGIALDENTTPSAHSWANLGGWSPWAEVAQANGLPDGEWGIRADVSSTGALMPVYNVYRSAAGGDYLLMFNGQGIADTEYTDNFVTNGTEYCYQVTAVYDDLEGDPAGPACAVPEAQTIYELVYDDGEANTSTNVTDGNFLAVRFTPAAYPSKLIRAKYYVEGASGGIAIAMAWDDDGTDGLPGTPLTSGLVVQLVPGWNVKDMSGMNIIVDEGDLWVGWQETAQTPPIGVDTDSPSERSAVNITGTWEPFSTYFDGAIMIRVDMDSAGSVAVEDLRPDLPESFALEQNYPNPFNPVTHIAFAVPEAAQVRLTLYDLMGRQVQQLLARRLEPGYYRYQLNAGTLASGVYLYRLEAFTEQGGSLYSKTRKLVVMK
jgi:hypothetical protein